MGNTIFPPFLVLVCGVLLFSLVDGSRKFQMFENCILILSAFYFYFHVPWQLDFQTDKKEEEEHSRFYSAGYKGDGSRI